MIASFKLGNKSFKADLSKPLDISIPLRHGEQNVSAWYVNPPRIEPHREGDFVGSVDQGASINFNDIYFNPHAHGTHTECLGHITEQRHSVNQTVDQYFFQARLITIAPEKVGDDLVISRKQLQKNLSGEVSEALVIRTLPNTRDKVSRQYSHTNPPYFTEEAIIFLVNQGIMHLLVDLPSIDKEKDEGELLGHRAFWGLGQKLRPGATITEFIYVSHKIKDGSYLLELQMAPFENDASPSRPVLYQIF
ncbi:cyclase family protein [Muriicola soli]|uniref:Cyclase family protein n=1 Tax=Muriicola soli TaxID=2507538 RepID=A0A411E6J9_9FLAO|nr:cyclase family protein [Muriicola soli]QBA63247.1 cyclase family protein [Muriicola soli]